MPNLGHPNGKPIMDKAKLVVAVPVYNGARTLLASLVNIASQDYANFRAIIVENCSTDETYEIARAFCEKDPRFEILRNEQHLSGIDNFMNTVRLASERGEYFCLRACDDLSTLDYLSKLVGALDENPSKLLAVAASKRFTGEQVQTIRPAPEALSFLDRVMAGAPPKKAYFPSDWVYGVFRSGEGARIFIERWPALGTPWCVASYMVYEFVMRGLVVYVEGPFFHFYYNSNSKELYAAKTLKDQFIQRCRYTLGCYRVLDKLPPLPFATRLRILRMLWRDSGWRTGYRLRKAVKTYLTNMFSRLGRAKPKGT